MAVHVNRRKILLTDNTGKYENVIMRPAAATSTDNGVVRVFYHRPATF